MPPPTCSRIGFVASTILLASAFAVHGAEPREIPDGLAAGPVIFRPWFGLAYEYNSNVFYLPPSQSQGSDFRTRLVPGVGMNVPFRNSTFDVDVRANYDSYRDTELDRKLSLFADLRLDLAFASTDHLGIDLSAARALAETTNLDRGGEFFFRAQPYDQRTVGIGMSRKEFGRRGYVLQVVPQALTYDPNVVDGLDQSRFYSDYRGYTVGLEYREPITLRHWFTAAFQADRYDYFCRDRELYPDTCGVGRSYRGESGDILWLGVSGILAKDQPYSAKVGWASFRYRHDFQPDYLAVKSDFESDYEGIVVALNGTIRIARPLQLILAVSQRPWSSIDDQNNYFLQRAAVVSLVWTARGSDTYGAGFSAATASYPLPSFDAIHRRDDTVRAELYANVRLRDLLRLRLSLSRQKRDSNVQTPEFDYDGTIFSVGLALGWGDR